MLHKLWKILAVSSAAFATLVMGAVVAQAETFSVDNVALNTNNNFRLIDGNPRMSIWSRNDNDSDQQFDRLAGNRGGTLLKHRSTGKCLNAHYLSEGAEINVWSCDGNDPDQNWNLINVSNGRMLLQRTGTNLCIDTPTRDNGGKVHLWTCDSNNGNQRWISSTNPPPPPPPNGSNIIVKASTSNLNFNRGQQWVTSTNYKLIFQGDGNLVLYNPQGKPIWATGTDNTGADIFAVQADGNVVLYNHGKPVWATNTSGRPGAFLAIQTDGNVVVYASNGTPIFATGTDGGRVTTFSASADWLKKNGGGTTPPPSPIVDMVGLQKLLFRNVSSTLTSPYGMQNCQIWKTTYWNCQHPALDIAAPVNSPIYSPIEGVVIRRTDNIGAIGIYNQKSNKTFFFLHMNRTDVVLNQRVTKGQQVGIEGTKGHVTGPHLHFEARPGNQPYMATDIRQTVNPLDAVNQANQ